MTVLEFIENLKKETEHVHDRQLTGLRMSSDSPYVYVSAEGAVEMVRYKDVEDFD